MDLTSLEMTLDSWFKDTPYGQYLLNYEKTFYQQTVANIFGYHALQLSLPNINFLENNKIINQYHLNQNIKCNIEMLPFENNSVDLIICPHSIELTPNYYQVLSECYRIMAPKGKLIITGFNQYRFSSNMIFKPKTPPLYYIKLKELQANLTKLNFQTIGGKFLSYCPPFKNPDIFNKFAVIDKIGDRWFPTFANIYALVLSKEVVSTTWLKPKNKSEIMPQIGIVKS